LYLIDQTAAMKVQNLYHKRESAVVGIKNEEQVGPSDPLERFDHTVRGGLAIRPLASNIHACLYTLPPTFDCRFAEFVVDPNSGKRPATDHALSKFVVAGCRFFDRRCGQSSIFPVN
jgi:hypothetical protein